MLSHWRRVESLIKEGIGLASAQSPSPVVTEVARRVIEWLEHNELGLALDDCESLKDALGADVLPSQRFDQARFEITSYEAGQVVEVERRLNLREVTGWPSFHLASSQQLDFPAHYGRNMDAWIDCIEELAEESAGQGRLILRLTNWGSFMEAFTAIVECIGFINTRRRAVRICLDILSDSNLE